MKTLCPAIAALASALAIAAVPASASAVNDSPDSHHPSSSVSAPRAKTAPGKSNPAVARMQSWTKAMQEVHEKMVAAKTPEERSALMRTHMEVMHDGLAMMNAMRDSTSRDPTMAAHIDMAETMMQMMMDCMPMPGK